MKKRILGNSGLEVSAIGLGCMGFSQAYYAVCAQTISTSITRTVLTRYNAANERLIDK